MPSGLFRAPFLLHLDAILAGQQPYGLLEAASLHVAHEAYGVRRLAAAEAFPDIERRADPERGVTLVVERAERHEVLAGAP